MPGQNVEVVSGDWMNPIKGYKLTEGDTITEIDKEFVIHGKFFNPLSDSNNPYYGLSPLRAAANTLSKNNAAEELQLKQFEKQAPPYILYPKAQKAWNLEQKEQRKGWLRKFAADKKDEIYVAGEEVGLINLGVSAGDLKVIESSEAGLRKLCNVYGMPPQLFGDTKGSTYNNIIEAKKDGWNNGLKPLLDVFAKHLTLVAQLENPNFRVYFDYTEIPELQEDIKDKVSWMKQAFWTPNEIREATGKDIIADDLMNQPLFTTSDVPLSDMNIDLTIDEPA